MCKSSIMLLMVLLWALLPGCGGEEADESSDADLSPPSEQSDLSLAADAGADQGVTSGDSVTLTGSGSASDARIESYHWSQVTGPIITLAGQDLATVNFTAPAVTQSETLTFRLTVTDEQGAVDSDTVAVTVNAATQTPLPGGNPQFGLRLGTNLGAINYWSTEWMFKDLFKMTVNASGGPGHWIAHGVNGQFEYQSGSLDLDDDGWIRSLDPAVHTGASAFFMRTGDPDAFPSGQYIVLYQGQGTINYSGDVSHNAALSSPGRDVLDVNYTGDGFYLTIQSTDPNGTGDYLRDIAVIMPGGICADDFTYAASPADCASGYEAFEYNYQTSPFHPQFLSDLAPYSALRFMAYFDGGLMYATRVDWDSRALPGDASYQGGGPIEVAVDLVNQVDGDFWYNLPVAADDRYIREAARVIHGRLESGRNLILELGNEVWNWAPPFNQGTQYAVNQAVARWGDQGDGGANYGMAMSWYGMRSAQACQIFKQEFAADSGRMECVIGNQAANSWLVEQAVTCPFHVQQDGGTPCHQVVDAIATAPYMADNGSGHATASDVLTALRSDMSANVDGYMRDNKAVADRYGLEYHAYEGGQHLVDHNGDTPLQQLYHAANRDPEMENVYLEYFTLWQNHGGGLFMHFTNVGRYSRSGAWGAMEYQGQTDAPKYQALSQVGSQFNP